MNRLAVIAATLVLAALTGLAISTSASHAGAKNAQATALITVATNAATAVMAANSTTLAVGTTWTQNDAHLGTITYTITAISGTNATVKAQAGSTTATVEVSTN